MATDGSGPVTDQIFRPAIIATQCSGCGRCIAICRARAIALKVTGYRKHALLKHPEYCNGCGRCRTACPLGAIH